MSSHSLGLQWKLAAIYLAVSLVSTGMVAAGYYMGTAAGMEPASALGAGIAAGLATGLLGSALGFMTARSLKLRLWDASEMAGRIAGGDFSPRLPDGNADEIGWLEQQLNAMASHLEGAVNDLRQLAEQNRKLAEEAGRGAAIEERAKLARDLHDTVNQQLFVLAMRAAAARRRLEKLGGPGAEALVPELATLEELARGAHGEARQLILQLRPTTLEQQGLGPALAEYVKAAAAKEGWTLEDGIDPAIRLMGKPAENLFRVAQEALNNVNKHARAQTVWVTLSRTADDEVQLQVRDDGEGFDLKAGVRPTAVGLAGMSERVEALGGTLRVKSSKGQGTEVTVLLPASAEGGEDA
jgi:two-component system, NarL family, sensor histidine kinase LiaS